jgi:hypothetical protein
MSICNWGCGDRLYIRLSLEILFSDLAPMSDAKKDEVSITVEFRYALSKIRNRLKLTPCSGGLEMLFNNERKLKLGIPTKDETGAPTDVASLVRHMCEKVMKDPRKELFILDGTVYVQDLYHL